MTVMTKNNLKTFGFVVTSGVIAVALMGGVLTPNANVDWSDDAIDHSGSFERVETRRGFRYVPKSDEAVIAVATEADGRYGEMRRSAKPSSYGQAPSPDAEAPDFSPRRRD